MLTVCYYYDDIKKKCFLTDTDELLDLKRNDPEQFLRRKEQLYRNANKKTRLCLVKSPLKNYFFRTIGNYEKGNSPECFIRENESNTHLGNKQIIAEMKELTVIISGKDIEQDTKVKLYIDYSELEKTVVCNGRRYEVDVYLKLKRTDPAEFFYRWKGELWVEVCWKCPVDSLQATDFAIERKTLFEYKIAEDQNFYDHITVEGLKKRKSWLKSSYEKEGIEGTLFCESAIPEDIFIWRTSMNGNATMVVDGVRYTVFKPKDEEEYAIIYDNKKCLKEFNKQKIKTKDAAKKIVEFIALLKYKKKQKMQQGKNYGVK